MTLVDDYPNVERALTTIDAMLITGKEYQILKNISEYIRENIEKELECEINYHGFIKYYIEKTLRNSDYVNTFKKKEIEIIIANILLPDDVKIAELLNKNEFTIEHLKVIIRFRSLVKNIILNSGPIDEELQRQFDIYKKYVAKLIELFKSEFNISDQTIILNRICEMLITCPNYFETQVNANTKKR